MARAYPLSAQPTRNADGTGAICVAILRCERAGSPQRIPTYASGCQRARASSGSQLAPVPVPLRAARRAPSRRELAHAPARLLYGPGRLVRGPSRARERAERVAGHAGKDDAMLQERIEGKWIEVFAAVFRRCDVTAGLEVAILSETQSRPVTVALAELALLSLGAR